MAGNHGSAPGRRLLVKSVMRLIRVEPWGLACTKAEEQTDTPPWRCVWTIADQVIAEGDAWGLLWDAASGETL